MKGEDSKRNYLTLKGSRSLKRTDHPRINGTSLNRKNSQKSSIEIEWHSNPTMPTVFIYRHSRTLTFID